MSTLCRHVHVRPHCFMLIEACSCRLELAYFAGKISKNRLFCKNAVALAYYGSCRLLVMGSCEKSVHLQVLQILHILCFTDVNSETKTRFLLVKFLNSTSEYMNQKRQVFEFFIQGALRELISHDSLSSLVQSQWK